MCVCVGGEQEMCLWGGENKKCVCVRVCGREVRTRNVCVCVRGENKKCVCVCVGGGR